MNRLGFGGAARAFAAGLMLTVSAGLFGGGCEERCGYADGCFRPCAVDGDCEEPGSVCRAMGTDDELTCTQPCTKNSDCADGPNLVCRCTEDASTGFCGYPGDADLDGPSAGPMNELCAEEYSVALGCDLLCKCPCSYHDLCYDTTNGTTEFEGPDCRGGCEAAFETFPDCGAELDAYYRCGVSKAQCVESSDELECPNGWPYCWGTPPDEACSTEKAALETCASPASWRFFFPLEAAAE